MEGDEGRLKLEWGDGVSALDRMMRTIVMMIDGAIGELLKAGFDRDADDIHIVSMEHEVFPTWVNCRGRRVYEITLTNADGVPTAYGHWLHKPRKRWWKWLKDLFVRSK